MIKRINKACSYFPCHKGLEDCAFCYCPLYPCKDEKRGEYVCAKNGWKVWSCHDCNWIHKKRVTDEMFDMIRKNAFIKTPQTANRKPQTANTGIIILGHGSRLKKANDIVPEIIKGVKNRLAAGIIVPAYLQFCQPNISKSIKNLVNKGIKKIVVVPFFLFKGNHVRRDIPKVIEEEKVKYPGIEFVYAKNLGEDLRIGDIVVERIMQCL